MNCPRCNDLMIKCICEGYWCNICSIHCDEKGKQNSKYEKRYDKRIMGLK